MTQMLKIAVPNKGSLSEKAVEILAEAGYKTRKDAKTLSVADIENGVEFYYLRPKDIAIYIGSGHLDLGITGRDLAADTTADVHELLPLGFGDSTFNYAVSDDHDWSINDLDGKRIATSYPHLVKDDLARRGLTADVIRLDGAVEISIQLGVADAIADVVSTGHTLRSHNLHTIGDPLLVSEATVIGRTGSEITPEQQIFLNRIQGILHAQNYLMLDYNIQRSQLETGIGISPGISAPTISPLAQDEWVAVRAMIPRGEANKIMDELATVGAEAILASEIRIARI